MFTARTHEEVKDSLRRAIPFHKFCEESFEITGLRNEPNELGILPVKFDFQIGKARHLPASSAEFKPFNINFP